VRSRENHKKGLKDRDAGAAVGQGPEEHVKRIKNKKSSQWALKTKTNQAFRFDLKLNYCSKV